jgi:hypothetical protein
MPDPHRIKNELLALLSSPHYTSLLHHRNQFRDPKKPPDTPDSLAAATSEWIFRNNPLLNPVEVLELRGYVELYRAHDGRSGRKTAGTLGGSWVERSVVDSIWKATAMQQGKAREDRFMEFMRTANFVKPEWNSMLFIACMAVPVGNSVVVVRGRGNWKAMRTPLGPPSPGAPPGIRTPDDVMRNLGMMPIPGTTQCVVPLYNDNWVQPVPKGTAKWPFLT